MCTFECISSKIMHMQGLYFLKRLYYQIQTLAAFMKKSLSPLHFTMLCTILPAGNRVSAAGTVHQLTTRKHLCLAASVQNTHIHIFKTQIKGFYLHLALLFKFMLFQRKIYSDISSSTAFQMTMHLTSTLHCQQS